MSSPVSIFGTIASHMLGQGNLKLGQQDADIKKREQANKDAAEQRAAEEHDQGVAGMVRQGFLRPVFNDMVREEHPMGSTDDPGEPGAKTVPIWRPADKSAIVKHKDSTGQTLQFELAPQDEQYSIHARQLLQTFLGENQPGIVAGKANAAEGMARATQRGTAAGVTEGRVNDLNTRGVRLGDEDVQRYQLPASMAGGLALPETLEGLSGKIVPAQIRQDTALKTNAATNKTRLSAAEIYNQGRLSLGRMKISSAEDIAAARRQLEQEKADRDQSIKAYVAQNTAAINSGNNPTLAAIKLRPFTEFAGRMQAQHNQADDLDQQILAAHEVLGKYPDGENFPDPFSGGLLQKMDSDKRAELNKKIGEKASLAQTLRKVANSSMQDLGMGAQSQPSSQSGAAPNQGAAQPQGGGQQPQQGGGASRIGQLPPTLESSARAIADYNAAPPTGARATYGPNGRVMARARELFEADHPGEQFDNTAWGVKQKAAKDYAPGGDSGKQANALNTLVRHTDDLMDLIPQLGNGKFNPSNAAFQKLKSLFGDQTPTDFDQMKQFLAGETVKLVRGGGGAEGDIEAAQRNISTARSPEQLQGALMTNFEVAGGRMEALNEAARKSHLGKDFSVLDNGATAIARKRGLDPKTLKRAAVAPIKLKDGRTITPHSQADADALRKDHPELIQ